MNPWRPYPMVRVVIPFVAGVWFGLATEGRWCLPDWLNILFLLFAFFGWRSKGLLSAYSMRVLKGGILFLLILVAGLQVAGLRSRDHGFLHAGEPESGLYLGSVSEPPMPRGERLGMFLHVIGKRVNGVWKKQTGVVLATAHCKSLDAKVQYGDLILFSGTIQPLSDNGNPNTFSYQGYLLSKGVTGRVYLKAYEWRISASSTVGFLKRWAFSVRDRLLGVLGEQNLTGREYAVAAALLLGYTGEIDATLRSEFASSGAMHILSVSGMHVGIIYLFCEMMLGFLGKTRATRCLKTLLLLLLIWAYALITGFSPSVLRASVMLSCVVVARTFDRSPEIINILAASLLILIAIDPTLLFDVGLQLSYLAVAGIVFYYRPVLNMWTPANWALSKGWSILACSIAATLATLPLTLFVFHQFPNYFLLTNLVVVPLSSLIIYTGIATIACSPIDILASLAGELLGYLVHMLNLTVHVIDKLPGSLTTGVFITRMEMLSAGLLIIFLMQWIITRTHRYIFGVLSILVLLAGLQLCTQWNRLMQTRFVVFNIPGVSVLDFVHQDKGWLLWHSNESLMQIPPVLEEVIGNNDAAGGIRCRRIMGDGAAHSSIDGPLLFQAGQSMPKLIAFNGKKIALVRTRLPAGLVSGIKVDLLVVGGNIPFDLTRLVRLFTPGEIVFDGSNSMWRVRRWCLDGRRMRVPCHAVQIHGAFIKDF